MSRFLIALNVQDHFNPSQPMVDQIGRVAQQMPTVATLFVNNEAQVSFTQKGFQPGPDTDMCRVPTETIFQQHGYCLPTELVTWLKERGATEVLIAGGFHDERILAAGISLFDANIKPVMVPLLCYGNNWYEHTVTINLWEKSVGPVYQSLIELGIQG